MNFAPMPGIPLPLAPGLRLLLAPNPSPMTNLGTNTYLLGTKALAIIDPGPDDKTHLNALLSCINDTPVSHIIVTHSHLDHSPLARPLSAATGAPIYAYGDSNSGRSAIMQQLADTGLAGGGEGIDAAFQPDHLLGDGDTLTGADWTLNAIHTPGHIGNHLCLQWNDAIFSGDHVMGWASSLVSPPDGDLTDFMTSCTKLQPYDARIYYPGHGAPVLDPAARLHWLISHRKSREAEILSLLAQDAATIETLTNQIYQDLPAQMHPIAARNVFAHLVDLHQRGIVRAQPSLSTTAHYTLTGK